MARPRSFDPDDALARAMDAFWAKGYDGTTMDDLVAATGLKKGSLYAAFGDKHRLYLAAIERYERIVVDAAIAALRTSADPWHGLAVLFEQVVAAVDQHRDRRGCLICNASIDRAPYDRTVERRVLSALARLQRAIAATIRRARPALSPADADAVASQLLAGYMGMRVMARAGVTAPELRRIADSALRAAADQADRLPDRQTI